MGFTGKSLTAWISARYSTVYPFEVFVFCGFLPLAMLRSSKINTYRKVIEMKFPVRQTIPVADSFCYMAKPIQYCKVKK